MNGIQVTFTARVAREATSSTSPTGVHRTRIKVDVPVTVDTRTGETKNTWATVTALGEHGELLKSLAVGDFVFVEGMLRLDAYEKNGAPRIGIGVNAKFVNRVADQGESNPPAPARVMAEEPPRWLKQEARGERRRRDFHGSGS